MLHSIELLTWLGMMRFPRGSQGDARLPDVEEGGRVLRRAVDVLLWHARPQVGRPRRRQPESGQREPLA